MDISELKWNEGQVRLRSRELEQSELKYKSFADHAPIGVGLINMGGFVEYMNEAWFAITDQSRDDHNARPWLKTVHPDDFEKIEASFDDLVACKGPLTVEARLKKPWSINGQNAELDQGTAWILASGYAEVNSDGTLKNVVCWITDISAQKAAAKVLQIKMDEALERKRQQENFIDTISHEIRNPLSAVLHCAKAIESSLNEAISAMAIPASKSTQNFQQSKLSDTLKNAADDAKTIALVQVLINLVTNAIKFTRNRARRQISVKISASLERPTKTSTSVEYFPERVTQARRRNSTIPQHDKRQGDDIYLSLAVTDTGKGLSIEEKTRLFQRFAQGSTKTHAEYGGSGLGLFISRQITETMGGEIGVASEEGKGSTFFFFVKTQHAAKPKDEVDGERSVLLPPTAKPVPVAVDAELAPPLPIREAEFEAKPPAAKGPTPSDILVVEDNLVNQKVLSKQLSTRGYEVKVANHGGEALASIHKTTSYKHGGTEPTFDVILMDVEMPHMDGLTCVPQIRSLEAGGLLNGHVAIVAVTANVCDEHVSAAVDAGMDAVTTKPYRMDGLLEQMKKAYNSTR
ncbi:hypothetical protein H2201_005516 [Coniosporium apollinis]|uniref:Histidine kinase n=1 Tax=Coniosporium apollinis TaxID=61459 RepID=A0ABQ9NT65_9PEZI|nr:hypothetical protein H2201_005516 [Coniosporium apollinis]